MPSGAIEKAAIDYLARGWSVIPMRERAKRPAIAWKAYQRKCASDKSVRRWFGGKQNYNVGIVTGSLSGLVVLDVDPGHGGTGSLRALERKHGALPETMTSKTGGGGSHFYFAHPGGDVHNRTNIKPGIDLRGDGGCIVAPPSIHPSGKPYTWVKGHAPGQLKIAALPKWLQ